MMEHEARSARELLAPFRVDPGEALGASEAAALRARMVPALRGSLRRAVARRAAVRRWRRAGLAASGLAAAAAVMLFVATRGPRAESDAGATLEVFVEGGRVVHRSASGEVPVDAGRPVRIAANGALATLDDAQARLTVGGVEIGLAGRSEVGLEELGAGAMERVRLHGGSVRCVVPPLGEEGRFSVVTPDTTVVVHGTVFSVEVSPDLRAVPRTCVVVEDGAVSVRHRSGIARLRAGESWGCAERGSAMPAVRDAAAASAAKAIAVPPPDDGALAAAKARPPAVPRAARPGSEAAPADLAEQNRLFQGALAAERRGDRAAATAALRELLRKHPSSPLAPEARTMLGRLRER